MVYSKFMQKSDWPPQGEASHATNGERLTIGATLRYSMPRMDLGPPRNMRL